MLRMQEEDREEEEGEDADDDDDVDDDGEEVEEENEGGGHTSAEGAGEKKKKGNVKDAAVQGVGGSNQTTVGSGGQSASVKRTIQKAVHIHEDDEFASSDSDEVGVR